MLNSKRWLVYTYINLLKITNSYTKHTNKHAVSCRNIRYNAKEGGFLYIDDNKVASV